MTPNDRMRISAVRSRQRDAKEYESQVAAEVRALVLELVERGTVREIAEAFEVSVQRIYAIMKGA